MNVVDAVYELIEKRDLSTLLPVYEMAKRAIPAASDKELLALHEAVVDSLNGVLVELGEHGLQNQASLNIESTRIDLQTWMLDCATSWDEVKRLRNAGVTSNSLVSLYMQDWMDPIGSRDWQNKMRLAVAHRKDPTWIERVTALITRTQDL